MWKQMVFVIWTFLLHYTEEYKYATKFIEVPVDHFSFTNNATFKLRYLVNDTQWEAGGPIFFYTGNEGDITIFAENTGFMWEAAVDFNALVVFAEHRYYGVSLPFGDKSYQSPQHLGYLTSEQALADYVLLINELQKNQHGDNNNNEYSPVVAFGGSYGGMLSAWLRMKYPASVIGALAASAPILQFNGLTPCGIFNRITTSVYRASAPRDCTEVIRRAWSTIRTVGATDKGKTWISSNWNLCKPLSSAADIDNLIGWVSEILVNTAMANYPYPANFLAPLPGYPVRAICHKMQDLSVKDYQLLTALGNALSVFTNYTATTKCNDIGQSGPTALGTDGWNFQACTEMIMPMCSTDADMFENQRWDFKQYSQGCYATYKVLVTNEDLAVLQYGGSHIKSASNIIFSNGLLDPWSGGGVLHNISKAVAVILIPEGAHHLDLRASNPQDPKSVVAARNFEKNIIRSWLTEYYGEYSNKLY